MNTHINITMLYQDKSLDLRIPIDISVKKLIIELFEIYNYQKQKETYHLKVINKDIVILENELLKNYPLSNGDLIQVI